MTAESAKNIDGLVKKILELNAVEMTKLKNRLQEETGVQLVAASGGAAGAAGAADSGPKEVKIMSVNGATLSAVVRGIINISKKIGNPMKIVDASAIYKKVSGGEAVTLDFVKPEDAERVIGELTELGLTCA
jgi:ribosomal protein L7/L12